MARRTADITITAEGRDRGKVFRLTEMSARQAEEWATRALIALAKSGVEIPDDIVNRGLAGVAALGFMALRGLSFSDAKPLLDEMMTCVLFVPDPKRPAVARNLVEDDIEEVGTFFEIRKEVFQLHVDFSKAVALSTSVGTKMASAT
jgi:hypothetical protein